MTMKIKVKDSTMVRPVVVTRRVGLWLSNLDLISPNIHVVTVHFYRHNGVDNFFDAAVLKAALGRALVAFCPLAGRFKRDKDGRVEIDCNGEGVLFVEAETDEVVDDIGHFAPTAERSILIPAVDCSQGISTYPLLVLQITHFKCGGVCLGVGLHHHVADGISAMHFVNTWSDIARGLDITIPPFIDRTVIRARNARSLPKYKHVEFQPRPSLKIAQCSFSDAAPEISASTFKLTRGQLEALKSTGNKDSHMLSVTYTTYETLAGHIWRCVCQARGLPEIQDTMLYLICDGRSRLQPRLPRGYFGNAVFPATVAATSGDLLSQPLSHAVSKVHEAITHMDNDYLSSALDYLELQPDLKACARGPHCFSCPNIGITSWSRLPFYDADFGWGRPIFVGPGKAPPEGKSYVLPSPTNDGSLFLTITLPNQQMMLFEMLLYNIDSVSI